MKKRNRRPAIQLLFTSVALLLASCWSTFTKKIEPPVEYATVQPEAYVPVYGTDTLVRGIRSMTSRPTEKAGKIYVYGKLLFQVESRQGIHVIDYSDKLNPVKLGFIRCKGSSELAVKDGFLVTNNLDDLVTIDIRQPGEVMEVARIKNAFPHFNFQQYMDAVPPEKNKYYVCPDFHKGDITGWKKEKNVSGAYCYSN